MWTSGEGLKEVAPIYYISDSPFAETTFSNNLTKIFDGNGILQTTIEYHSQTSVIENPKAECQCNFPFYDAVKKISFGTEAASSMEPVSFFSDETYNCTTNASVGVGSESNRRWTTYQIPEHGTRVTRLASRWNTFNIFLRRFRADDLACLIPIGASGSGMDLCAGL